MKQRYDSAKIKARFDANGFLHDEPIIARIGIQEYMKPDGTVQREFRPASEVFKSESMKAFQGMPIVEGHKEITVKNAKGEVVGAVSGSARRDGIGLLCPIVIHDEESIESAKRGDSAELSVGYTTNDIHREGWGNVETGDYVFKDDTELMEKTFPNSSEMGEEWKEFDVLQTNIVPNHVAKVRKGRAGIAKLNLDGSEEIKYDEDVSNKPTKENTMKIKIDAVDVEVSAEVGAHVSKLDAAIAAAKTKADSLEAERDGLKVKVDGIPKLIADALADAKVKADAENEVLSVAREAGIKVDGLDVKAVKVAFIKEVLGVDATNKTDAYIDTSFEVARDSDKMAANRAKVHGEDAGKEKNDSKDEFPNPQDRFRK